MVPLTVVMFDVLVDDEPQVPLAEEHHPAQTLLLDRAHKSFCVGVRFGLLAGNLMDSTPLPRKISPNAFVNSGSRSWIR